VKRLALLISLLVTGCVAQRPAAPLPQYPLMDATAALRTLQARAARLHTLSGTCTLVLTRSDGQSIQLDAAVAMAPPDRLRLRAWKANEVVFDLTLLPNGLWIETADDPRAKSQIVPATLKAAEFSRQLLIFSGGFFDGASVAVVSPAWFVFRRDHVYCQVNRSTLTASRYWVVDSSGRTRFTLDLADYSPIDGIPWPMKFTAIQPGGDRIDIQFDAVNVNSTLARGAFIPPRRAEKRS